MTQESAHAVAVPAQEAPASPPRPEPKWAAVVGDRLVPLPHRRVKVSDVSHQAGLPPGTPLFRDYMSPRDVKLQPDDRIDLAEGNVFRTEPQGTPGEGQSPDAPAKLAFVADDDWELASRPEQTGQTLRGLFNLAADAQLLRDYESPHDESVEDDERVQFADGPVFRTRVGTVTVQVNNNPVRVPLRGTGLSLKQAAIAQSVAIRLDFLLFRVHPDGSLSPPIPDDRHLTFHEGQEFRCVAPDDNS